MRRSANCHRDDIVTKLTESGVKFEVRSLKIGDFVWICRSRDHELILPYVIERKRMDDFACSIKDGRFDLSNFVLLSIFFFLTDNFRYHEQKFRLKKCGIDNKIYLIESHVNYGLPLSNLRQAATNTAIQDNFHVKFTETPSSTVRYLTELTRTLHELFQVS